MCASVKDYNVHYNSGIGILVSYSVTYFENGWSICAACMCSWRMPCWTKSWNTVVTWRTSRSTRTSRAKQRTMWINTCLSFPEHIGLLTTHRSLLRVV